jgi:L-fuculose-phosphate aldolase
MNPTADPHESIKDAIIATCRRLEKIGFIVGTWGNVSVRVPEGFIVTPSKIGYDVLQPADFVVVSLDGKVLAGHRLPSSETAVHRALLNKKPNIGAIIHTHSPCATAVAGLHRSIPAFVEDLAQIAGGEIRCTRYVPAGQHEKLAEEVANTIGEENAVLLANHGVFCCGRDLEEAFVTGQIVEKAAQMMLLAGGLGPVIPIPDEFVRSERQRFLYRYGTTSDGVKT